MRKFFKSATITLILLIWLGGYVYFVMATLYAKPEQRNVKTDAIIVLTGGNFRIATGLKLFAEGLSTQLMITGVNEAVTEAEIRRLWKGKKTLPACCITLGHLAKTTRENANETKIWAHDKNLKSIRLVTSAYHMQRALQEFRLKMPEVKIFPHPVEKEDYAMDELKFWIITLSEYNKYILRSIVLAVRGNYL